MVFAFSGMVFGVVSGLVLWSGWDNGPQPGGRAVAIKNLTPAMRYALLNTILAGGCVAQIPGHPARPQLSRGFLST